MKFSWGLAEWPGKRGKEIKMEEMGMTDNQWKDFLRGYKADLEDLKEYHEKNKAEEFEKKIDKMLNRIQEGLEG